VPRSLWTGSLSFGLINVPVALNSAVRDQDIHFRQIVASSGTPVEQRRFCSKEDVEVDWAEVAHGYETDGGEMIILTDEELEAAAPRRTRTIDIEQFVQLEEVDPIYFDHPYLLSPVGESEGTARAYRLLVEAMKESGKAALGRVVIRKKEYLVLVRERDGVLTLNTMLFADEVRAAKDVDSGSAKKPAKKELDQAVSLIESLSVDWDPERYEDNYRKRLEKVIADKRKGKTIKAPAKAEEPAAVPDLMAALEKTLAEMKGAKKGSGSKRKQPAKA
jgi:DNA end-binding protein Ku